MITAKRFPDWRPRLSAALLADAAAPHAWGGQDCFMGLVVPSVFAMTGLDIGAPYRGRYTSAAGAQALLEEEGFASIADYMASLFTEIHPAKLGIGDIASLPDAFGAMALGVCGGDHLAVMGDKGKGSVPLRRAIRAFKVG